MFLAQKVSIVTDVRVPRGPVTILHQLEDIVVGTLGSKEASKFRKSTHSIFYGKAIVFWDGEEILSI